MLPVACIGVAGDGLAIVRFPRVGWAGIGVAGDGFACGFAFGESAGFDGVAAGAAVSGPFAGVGVLLREGLLL